MQEEVSQKRGGGFVQILPLCDTKVTCITSFKGPVLCQNLLEDLGPFLGTFKVPPSCASILSLSISPPKRCDPSI